jgi:hypothetical protein
MPKNNLDDSFTSEIHLSKIQKKSAQAKLPLCGLLNESISAKVT